MNTTAGSYALLNSIVPGDATVTAKLRAKGAIILGKASLSEFAMFKASHVENGWNAIGGQCQSAYVQGGFKAGGDPSGSSSGSAVGVSAGFAPAALGSETDGSIVSPAARAAAYGIKPSIGLVSRSGVIPIAASQDTVGPIAKSTYDAALLLQSIAGYDAKDKASRSSCSSICSPLIERFSVALDARDHLEDYVKYSQAPYATFAGKKLGVPRHSMMFNETMFG